jgi:hypothetical protein
MKILLTLLLVLLFTTSYSKPITLLTLRYKGELLAIDKEGYDTHRSITFNKSEIPVDVLIDAISKHIFSLDGDKVIYYLGPTSSEIAVKYSKPGSLYFFPFLPTDFVLTREIYNLK